MTLPSAKSVPVLRLEKPPHLGPAPPGLADPDLAEPPATSGLRVVVSDIPLLNQHALSQDEKSEFLLWSTGSQKQYRPQ